MKFSSLKNVPITEPLLKLFKEHLDWVAGNNFKALFDLWVDNPNNEDEGEIQDLTLMFYASDIDPLENLTEIPPFFLSEAKELIEVTVPSHIKVVGANAFYTCSNLETVTIEEGVEIIQDSAFGNCAKLHSIHLPTSLKSIGGGVFIWDTKLKNITYAGTQEQWSNINIHTGNELLLNRTIHCSDGDIEGTI